MCTAREALVSSRTRLVNSVRGWMRSQLLSIPTGRVETFSARVRRKTLARSEGLPEFIEQLLATIDAQTTQISRADYQLADLAKDDEICQRLMTVPGVGPVTAIRFVAALDDVSRFPNAHSVQSYLGLVPGEDSSSNRKRRTGITKAGPPRVRWALAQAGWALRLARKNDPLVLWTLEVEKRRGKMVAMTALARRLAGVLYAIWRDGTRYDPSRLR
jgi:transposase